MKLVAAAAAFLVGTAAALDFGLGPGSRIPPAAFFLLLTASTVGVCGALLARRHAGVGLLVIIALLGMWRGGHVAAVDTQGHWRGVPESPGAVTIEGELLTDPAPASSNTRLRLDVVAAISNGDRSDSAFKVDVFANRLVDESGSDATARPVNGFRYGDRYIVTGRFDPSRESGGPVAG